MTENLKIVDSKLLSDNWYVLKKITFDYRRIDGTIQTQSREVYDRGNGAVILLYNKENQTVILTKQLRIPTYFNQNPSGMLIEACAGSLDKDDPDTCIKKEALEEVGYKIDTVEKIFESYMSPGAVTEILYFYIAPYDASMKVSDGGGLVEEGEQIEVLELPIDEAMQMIKTGEIKDGKTIMLLQYVKLNAIL